MLEPLERDSARALVPPEVVVAVVVVANVVLILAGSGWRPIESVGSFIIADTAESEVQDTSRK